MKRLINILLIMVGLNSCMSARINGYTDMDVRDFAAYLANTPDVQILDVRTPSEYREGHISGALNINWYDKDFSNMALRELDKSRPVAVYCRSGMRSREAGVELARMGFHVTNLQGGIMAWENNHQPIVQ